jgi:hypothetical protein
MDDVSPNVPAPPLTTYNIIWRGNQKGVHCVVRARRDIMARPFATLVSYTLAGLSSVSVKLPPLGTPLYVLSALWSRLCYASVCL